jgi:hypothetical protein
VETDQIDIFTPAVFRDLEKVQDTEESRLARQLGSNVKQPNRLDRVDLDLAFLHAVSRAYPDAGSCPDADTARDLPSTYSLAKSLGERHESLKLAVKPKAAITHKIPLRVDLFARDMRCSPACGLWMPVSESPTLQGRDLERGGTRNQRFGFGAELRRIIFFGCVGVNRRWFSASQLKD